MANEITQFKYDQLDESTADFLRQKESNMRQIVGKAYTELGKELYEAQQRLASHNKYEGVFEKWYTYLGFKRQKVYDLINRFNLLRKSEDIETKELIESLPVTLSYQVSNPNAESTPAKAQAKSEVLAGDIATLKEYRERIRELERKAEQAEQQAEAERRERERLEQENEELLSREPEIRVEYVEKESEDPYDRMYDRPFDVERTNDFYEMMNEVDELYRRYAHLKDSIEEIGAIAKYDDDLKKRYEQAQGLWVMLDSIFNNNSDGIIDVEII